MSVGALLRLAGAVSGACLAAAPAPLRPAPYLWASAATPPGWEFVHDHVWRLRGAKAPAISVLFDEGVSVEDWIREEAEPSAFRRKAQRLASVRAGEIEHRGRWTLVETLATGTDGGKTWTLSAALPAPAGLYALTYWGHEPDYARHKAEALAFIDAFQRLPPALRYAPFEAAGKFAVSAPASPWTTVTPDVDAEARFIAPASPGGAAPGMLTVHVLGEDQGAAGRFLAQTCGGAATRVVRTRAGAWSVAEAVNRGRLETPEAPGAGDAPRRSQCAALTAGGRSYGLWWYAPPSAYDYGLPAFETALESFRPAR